MLFFFIFFFLSCHEFTNTICSLFLLSGDRLYVSTCQTFYTSVLNDPVSPQLGCFCTSILTRNPCVSERPLTFKYAWIFCHGCRCRRGFLRLHCVSLSSSRPLFFCTVVQLAHTHTHTRAGVTARPDIPITCAGSELRSTKETHADPFILS